MNMDKYMEYKKIIEELGCATLLKLCGKNIDHNDVQSLAEALKGTHVKELDIANNLIGTSGLKYLTNILNDTEITTLFLQYNNIDDEGATYFVESLKNTNIECVHLWSNKTTIDAAQYVTEVLYNSKIKSFHTDLYSTIDDFLTLSVTESKDADRKNIDIVFHSNKIGINGAQFIQNTFKNYEIRELKLSRQYLDDNDAEYFAQAFKNIRIEHFRMENRHIYQARGVEHLIRGFKESQIGLLDVNASYLESNGVIQLAEFLKYVKVLQLDLHANHIGDEGLKYLVPTLQKSDIMSIDLSINDIGSEGAKYLAEILRYSKIMDLNLGFNPITSDGIKHLAKALPFSQITHIILDRNSVGFEEHEYFCSVVDGNNSYWLKLYDSSIRKKADKIRDAFKELVSLDPTCNKFELISTKASINLSAHMEQCIAFFKSLKENPNFKVHLFAMMCKNGSDLSLRFNFHFDFQMIQKIDEFIAALPQNFINFFENELLNLTKIFESYDFVKLVREFEDMEHCDIVQYLLLHRILYYIDDNQEILHPYIYKLLYKYNMPLYNKHLEPNKKNEIIFYFQNRQKSNATEEIAELSGILS